jgi:hypothetical protein
MLLAGDVGGTKIFLGLFARNGARPKAIEIRSYRTLDFPDLGAVSLHFLRETSTDPQRHRSRRVRRRGSDYRRARAFDERAVDRRPRRAAARRSHTARPPAQRPGGAGMVRPVLTSDEIEVVHEGRPDAAATSR